MTTKSDALMGALAADAVVMPVHWYYDREALARDYGRITFHLEPTNPLNTLGDRSVEFHTQDTSAF